MMSHRDASHGMPPCNSRDGVPCRLISLIAVIVIYSTIRLRCLILLNSDTFIETASPAHSLKFSGGLRSTNMATAENASEAPVSDQARAARATAQSRVRGRFAGGRNRTKEETNRLREEGIRLREEAYAATARYQATDVQLQRRMTAELESANNRLGILSQAIDDAKKAQKKAEQDLLHANREFRDEQVVVLHDQVQQLNASVEDAAAFGLAAKRDLEQSQARERLLRQELEKAVSEAHALREEVRGAHNDYHWYTQRCLTLVLPGCLTRTTVESIVTVFFP